MSSTDNLKKAKTPAESSSESDVALGMGEMDSSNQQLMTQDNKPFVDDAPIPYQDGGQFNDENAIIAGAKEMEQQTSQPSQIRQTHTKQITHVKRVKQKGRVVKLVPKTTIKQSQAVTNTNNSDNVNLNINNDNGNYFEKNNLKLNRKYMSLTTEKFCFYICCSLNFLFLIFGISCSSSGLGDLWFELEYQSELLEFEYSFGWKSSSSLEEEGLTYWTDYDSLDDRLNTNIVEAGDLFEGVTVFGMIVLLMLGIFEILRKANCFRGDETNLCNINSTGILLCLSIIYVIFYIISILVWRNQFIDVCGEFISLLDALYELWSADNVDVDHYECVEDWGLYSQYINILICVVTIVLGFQIRKGFMWNLEFDNQHKQKSKKTRRVKILPIKKSNAQAYHPTPQ